MPSATNRHFVPKMLPETRAPDASASYMFPFDDTVSFATPPLVYTATSEVELYDFSYMNSYQQLQSQHIADAASDGSPKPSRPAKPNMLDPLYIPQRPTSPCVPIHSPVPSRYPASPHQQPPMLPGNGHYHQRHSSSGSSGGQPVLFELDLGEWHPAQSRSPPQIYSYSRAPPEQHSLSLNLNLNFNPSTSPASSLSSLSPAQMHMPLTPGHEFDYGGPPLTPSPIGYTGSVPVAIMSARGGSQAVLEQRRASLAHIPSSHPYYHQQRSAHPRPQQSQQARRSPLHQEYFDDPTRSIPEDDEYAGQYEKMYRERQRMFDQRRRSVPLVMPYGPSSPSSVSSSRSIPPSLSSGSSTSSHSPVAQIPPQVIHENTRLLSEMMTSNSVTCIPALYGDEGSNAVSEGMMDGKQQSFAVEMDMMEVDAGGMDIDMGIGPSSYPVEMNPGISPRMMLGDGPAEQPESYFDPAPSPTLVGSVAVGLGVVQEWQKEGREYDSADSSDSDSDGVMVEIECVKQRASTRTITARSTRSKASTQTLTPMTAAEMEDGGEEDAEGEIDGEEMQEEEEDLTSSDESDDDDKDGEFVLRSRSRSKGATVARSRAVSAVSSSVSAPRGRGRGARARASGRYNPYSLYAATVAAQTVEGSPQVPGLKTLNPSVCDGDASDSGSVSPSVEDGEDGSRNRKNRPTNSLPVPVPVPNLTKKSRGRRVPTYSSLEDLKKTSTPGPAPVSAPLGRKSRGGGGSKGTRMYLCDVEGCGKCFARGEHLKRHVRSIHTNEKPHTCPFPGCGKDFSRHDNLGQHMRVHKDFVPPPLVVKA